jgi:cyanate permease
MDLSGGHTRNGPSRSALKRARRRVLNQNDGEASDKRGSKAWLVAGGLFFTLFLLMGSTVDCVGLFFTPILKEFGWSHSRTSLIFMVLSGGIGLSSPVVGSLLNRAGARVVMSLGMLAVATGFIIGSRANSLPPLLVAFALIGLGVGAASFTPTQIVLSNWFEKRRGLAFGLTFAGANLGAVCVPPLVSQVVSRFGWRNSFLLIAGWAILIGIPNIMLLIRTHPTKWAPIGPSSEGVPLAGLKITTAVSTYTFWILVLVQVMVGLGLLLSTSPIVLLGARDPNISLLCVIGYALTFGLPLNASFTLGPMLLAESLGRRSFGPLAGILSFSNTFVSAVGPVLIGALYDLTNSYVMAFELCAVAYAVAAVAATTVVPVDGRDVVIGAAAEIYAD